MALAHFETDLLDDAGGLANDVTLNVTVTLESSGALASLFTDRAGATPKSNPFNISDGHVDFYVAGAAHRIQAVGVGVSRDLRYVAIGTAQEFDFESFLQSTAAPFATRSALQAVEGADYADVYLTETGREGLFKWDGSDLSSEVAADTAEGHYIAPDSDATGASGSWVRVDRSIYLPRHFGAAADGTTDDSAAISAMLDLIIQQGEGKVYVDGRVRLASQVSKTSLPDYFALSIEGPGASVGGFAVDNTTGGISLASASLRTISVELRNFYMDPVQDGSGDGFVLSLPEGGLQARHMAIVENVNFIPLDYTSAGTFDDPLSLTGLYRPRVVGCVFNQGTSATTKQGTILNLDGSYKPHIYDNYLNGAATYGCKHTSTGSEGLFFCFNSVNGPDYGLYQTDTTGREPEVYVEMNHFNCDVASIYIDGVKYFWIRDNLLYMQSGITSFDDILIINANGGLIADNIYRQPGGTDRRHINMAETGVIRDIVVQETAASFQGETSDPPIYIGDGVDNITLELPERLTADGYDGASYPDTIYEVHSGATNIYLETPAGNKRINSGAIDGQRPRPLVFAGTVAAHTGATGATTIKTVTIPGGAMGPNGYVRMSTFHSNTANANNKQLIGYFGGTGGILIDNRVVTTTAYTHKEFLIRNRGADNSQIATQANINSVEGTVAGAATGAVDTSADVDIVFRVNLSNSGDTVTLEHYLIEVFYVD